MPPAFFFRGHRGYGEKEHRIEDGQYEGQRKKRSEDVAGTSPLECDHRKKLTIPSTVSSTRSQKGEEVKRSLVVGGGCPDEEASIPGWLSEGGLPENVCP